jgi:hypothetical protein
MGGARQAMRARGACRPGFCRRRGSALVRPPRELVSDESHDTGDASERPGALFVVRASANEVPSRCPGGPLREAAGRLDPAIAAVGLLCSTLA